MESLIDGPVRENELKCILVIFFQKEFENMRFIKNRLLEMGFK